ncbi:unnamed protein product [Paramecium octaurelia]|uniref:Alpha-1,4 glucan phosphorylase n=1 Tax=Paramecium octaurelia TaxID=43137 RepID=A0A8S1UEV5_PAROT|nr:unnamed protein product [Paramecium octaurelia]
MDQKATYRTSTRRSTVQVGGSPSNMYRPEYQVEQFGLQASPRDTSKIWELMDSYQGSDKLALQQSIVHHVEYTLARTRFDFSKFHSYQALSHSVRDRLIEAFNDTNLHFHQMDAKRIYYLSLEFLIGRCLQNALVNLDLEDDYREALMDLGYKLEELYDEEVDPALGNGGLGRLAACFLDSLATLNYPSFGYGIRYTYGIFKQLIKDGYQVESPDFWLNHGNPWEIERLDVQYQIRFYGFVKKVWDHGVERSVWEGGETIMARAYDTPIPGYNTQNTIALRLWKSHPASEFDFSSFNTGDYFKALEQRQKAEYITSVLYPNDSTEAGKELRLKQQYLLVSASMQDIVRRFKRRKVLDWNAFPQKVAVQLNDTHPALAIVELLRILIDIEQLDNMSAWQIVTKSFNYTNHTVLPEALEKWGVPLIEKLLPRHLEIIYLINFLFLEKVQQKYPNNWGKLSALSIVEEEGTKKVRMANLSIVGSKFVNGVAKIHTELLKTTIFKEFFEMHPNKFQNKTNGVTPRRWVRCANPALAALYDRVLGSDKWVLDMEQLKQLESHVSDPQFVRDFQMIKMENKERFVHWIRKTCQVDLNIDSLFDIQVKRIHEYKRQLMNILYVIYRYLIIKESSPEERKRIVPRSVCFGGKAAPGYVNAKRVIKLINSVADVINNDHQIGDLLKVVFMPNYNVSNAQIIIPAAELSQHISTAGTEASGTSNMKFIMNGCLILGTLDGANVEIDEAVGRENIFIFGTQVEDVDNMKEKMRNTDPHEYFPQELLKVFGEIDNGRFGHNEELKWIVDSIRYKNDNYLVGQDFKDYIKAQQQVDDLYRQPNEWAKKSIYNAIRSYKFSSDRTIQEYAEEIWQLKPIKVPEPAAQKHERVKGVALSKSQQEMAEKIKH